MGAGDARDAGAPDGAGLKPDLFHLRRFLVSAMLGLPDGFGTGIDSGCAVGGASFARIALKLHTRGDTGKRLAAIVSRSNSARMARSARSQAPDRALGSPAA